jgi:glutathione-regulated potassium-efflux system protein KefB
LVTGVLLVGVIWLTRPDGGGAFNDFRQTLLIGLALALSSTAFALQTLEEREEFTTRHGRLSFSILLFQDLAAIPLLALIPVFAFGVGAAKGMGIIGAVKALGAIVVLFVSGRYLLDKLYALVASTGVREAMTASALLTVIAVSLLMETLGMTPSLGAFIAGIMLANSPYRHQLRSDIKPFETLLLGVFFTAIGMSLNFGTLMAYPQNIAAGVLGLITVKAIVLYAIGRWQGLDHRSARRLALVISQGGEFAFVIFTQAMPYGIISPANADALTLIVILSMLLTPLLLKFDDFILRLRGGDEPSFDQIPRNEGHVVIAGFGRVGQIVARILMAKRIPFTALDKDPEQVNFIEQFGNRIFYGDASRLAILEAAETHKARAFVLAIDDVDASLRTAQLVKRYFPHVPLIARARNRRHVHQLMDLGVKHIERETFLSSLEITRGLLRRLGLAEGELRFIVGAFKQRDEEVLYEDFAHYTDVERMAGLTRQRSQELEQLFAQDWREAEEAAARKRDGKAAAPESGRQVKAALAPPQTAEEDAALDEDEEEPLRRAG